MDDELISDTFCIRRGVNIHTGLPTKHMQVQGENEM